MIRITATIDEEGRLLLPEEVSRHLALTPGQQVSIYLQEPVAVPNLDASDNPFLAFVGSLPPLDVDSRTYYRRERGHEEDDE